MRHTLALLCCFSLALYGHAATIRNDDSCDIATLPAATLLLPYFEVDLHSPATTARTTLFTVLNTSSAPQIARVTLWTDWAFPVLTFNIFLTGYDVQSINLADVIGTRGTIALQERNVGSQSLPNDANPHFLPGAAAACEYLPGPVPAALLADLQSALTNGLHSSCGTTHVGGTHVNASGYLTIDLVATCGATFPNDPKYYDELLYDNVLGGDWQLIDPNPVTRNYAGGNPLVHIRAIPSGGPAGVIAHTNLPFTFYDHYTPHGDADQARMDRRQPLPATFTSRFIQGGTGAFNTNFMIWREAVTGGSSSCSDYPKNNSSAMQVFDEVRFDEHENPTTNAGGVRIAAYQTVYYILPATSSTATSAGLFPPLSTSGDVGGWMYMNLRSGHTAPRPTQNWITIAMQAEGRYQTMADATPLGNGCSAPIPVTMNDRRSPSIGPSP